MPSTRKRKPLGSSAEAKTKPKDQRGGAGRGQGRKPSKAKQASTKIAEEVLEGARYVLQAGDPLPDSATPLDIMLCAMRTAYREGGPTAAFPYAEKTAPYLHARIAQMELKNPKGENLRLSFTWGDEAATDGI